MPNRLPPILAEELLDGVQLQAATLTQLAQLPTPARLILGAGRASVRLTTGCRAGTRHAEASSAGATCLIGHHPSNHAGLPAPHVSS